MLPLHVLHSLVWLYLSLLALAYPHQDHVQNERLQRRAESQPESGDSMLQHGIITLPYDPYHNFSLNGTLSHGQHPYYPPDPFGPDDPDEPLTFDERIEIWGRNVYVEINGELEKNLDCTVNIYAHVLFNYKIGTFKGNLKDGIDVHINLKFLQADSRLYAVQGQDANRVIFEIIGKVWLPGRGRKYFHVQKEIFHWKPTETQPLATS